MLVENVMKKPHWLNKKVDISACHNLKSALKKLKLHTVCQEALCPNISECFSSGVATFMILGDICTRACTFCGVEKGKPALVDPCEPKRVKEAVEGLGLDYVVITSPTRDDLFDGGASMFAATVKQIKSINAKKKVEILIPDFLGKHKSIEIAAQCGAWVIAHNLETVPSLYPKVRKGADYNRSLKVLKLVKEANKGIFTKSGLMLGLGEGDQEVVQVLQDLRGVGCDFLTLGQYLPPSLAHYSIKEYVLPDKFLFFKNHALKLGFLGVKSAPYVRSSYMAHTLLPDTRITRSPDTRIFG
jgi:lipoic acid synthetase